MVSVTLPGFEYTEGQGLQDSCSLRAQDSVPESMGTSPHADLCISSQLKKARRVSDRQTHQWRHLIPGPDFWVLSLAVQMTQQRREESGALSCSWDDLMGRT